MDAASEDMSFKRSTFRIIIRNVKVMQFSFVRTEWGLLSSDRLFRNENKLHLKTKRFAWSTAQQCELPAPPGLLRQVRLKLWLRNYFPGRSVKPQLSVTLLTVASRWVIQYQIAWRGGP